MQLDNEMLMHETWKIGLFFGRNKLWQS